MSVYNRKGGFSTKSLKDQFNYYKRQLRNRLIEEQALKEARGLGSIETEIKTMFKHFDYQKIYENGITRKVGFRTIRFYGDEAIQKQIESYKLRASKRNQKSNFINNYLFAMETQGFTEEEIEYTRKGFNKLTNDKISYLIDTNTLPDLNYIYGADNKEEVFDKIVTALDFKVVQDKFSQIQKRKVELVKVIRERSKILGTFN